MNKNDIKVGDKLYAVINGEIISKGVVRIGTLDSFYGGEFKCFDLDNGECICSLLMYSETIEIAIKKAIECIDKSIENSKLNRVKLCKLLTTRLLNNEK